MKNKLIICLTFALGNRLLAAQAGGKQTAAQKIAAIKADEVAKKADEVAKIATAQRIKLETELKVVVNYFDELINWKNAQKNISKAFDAFLKTLGKDQLGNLILQAEDLKNKLTNQKINAFVKTLPNGETFLSKFEKEFSIILKAATKEEDAKEAAAKETAAKAKAIEAKVIEDKAKEAAAKEAAAKETAAKAKAKEAAAKIEIEAAAEKYSVSKFLTPEQKQYLGNFASIFVKNVLETEVPGLKIYKKDFWSRVKQWLTSKSTDNKYRINLAQEIARLLLGSFDSKKTITIDEYLNINSNFNPIRLETLNAELELAVIQKEIAILELKKAQNTSEQDHKTAAEDAGAEEKKTALEYKLAAETAARTKAAAAESKANAAKEALEAFQRETAAREAAMRELK